MARSGIVLLPSQAQTICYHGDKLGVRRLPLYTAYGITEELLEYFNITAIPCDLYRVAYGSLHARRCRVETLRNLRV